MLEEAAYDAVGGLEGLDYDENFQATIARNRAARDAVRKALGDDK